MFIAYSAIVCAFLVAIVDSIRCDGRNMRLLGTGTPNASGVDAAELRGKYRAARMLAKLVFRH